MNIAMRNGIRFGLRFSMLCLLAGLLTVLPASLARAFHVPPGAEGITLGGIPLHLTGRLHVEEIRDGLYYVTEGVYQSIFLVGRRSVILVDAPPSLIQTPAGDTLPGAIASVTPNPITHLVYSHKHKDHIGGANVIQAAFPDVEIFAHVNTIRALQEAHAVDPDDPRPIPTVRVLRRRVILVGHQILDLSNRGPFHAPGDLFNYAPRQKVLMAVDVVFPGWVPFANLALTTNVPGFIKAHNTILNFDFETFVGGHLTRLGTRADVEEAKDYVLAVQAAAGQALGTIPSLQSPVPGSDLRPQPLRPVRQVPE
ncbi:MAG: MBL fold metallo-hydrolase [Nitrospinota bacterium]